MSFDLEVHARMVAEGVLASSKIGIAPAFQIPTTGECIVLTEYPGIEALSTHNEAPMPTQEQPSMQVMVHAPDKVAATAVARRAYLACFVKDTTLSGVRYLYLKALQPPFPMGLDENNRVQMVFNIRALKRPS